MRKYFCTRSSEIKIIFISVKEISITMTLPRTLKKIDDTDLVIIRTLQRDARTNFVDVAKDLGVSIDTVTKRFKRLIRIGIVRGTTVLLDPKGLGFEHVASLEIDVDYPHITRVVDALAKKPEILICTPTLGRHDLFAIAVLKSIEDLGQLRESIKGYPMVRDVTTSIWIDEFRLCPENFEFNNVKKAV